MNLTNNGKRMGRIALGVLALLLAQTGSGNVVRAADDIRIGFTPPVTGVYAAIGAAQLKAIQLGVKQINSRGGVNGRHINLIVVDSQSTTPGAQAAVQKAVEQEKVLALISFVLSGQVLATSDAIKAYGIPTMIGGTHVSLTRKGNPWLFRVRPDDSIAALGMLKFIAEDMRLRKIGVLYNDDAFGIGGAELVEKGATERGMAIVRREAYKSGDRNFTTQLTSLRDAGAEIMVVYGHAVDAAWIQRQYREIGSPFKYIGSPGSQMKSTLDVSKEAAEGIIAIADVVPGSSEANRRYAEAYGREYNEEYDPTSAWVYDALGILAHAIEIAGVDREKLRKTILAIKGYDGVLGKFAFTPNGDGLHEISVVQIENGKPKMLKSIRVEPK